MRFGEFVGLILFALVMILFARAVFPGLFSLSGSKYRAYKQLATRYRGKYESRGLGEPPTVSFSYNGSNVRVGLAPNVPGQPSPPRTRVVARFPTGLPFRCEIHPFGRAMASQPPRGTKLVRSGQPDFDRGFVVQSNDGDIAGEFLKSGHVRQAIEGLRLLAAPTGILVSINPERLLVQVDRNLGPHQIALESAVRDAMILHDFLKASVSRRVNEGVAIVAVGPALPEDAGPPICKVCGEDVTGSHVLCAKCHAPHHGDCWSFVGVCSIFGCGCREAVATKRGPDRA